MESTGRVWAKISEGREKVMSFRSAYCGRALKKSKMPVSAACMEPSTS